MRVKLLGCEVETEDERLQEILDLDGAELITAEHFDQKYPGLLDAAFEAKGSLEKQRVKIQKFIITDRTLTAVTDKGFRYEVHGWRRK